MNMDLSQSFRTSPIQQKRQMPNEYNEAHMPIPSIEGNLQPHLIVRPTSPQPSNSPKAIPVLQLPSGLSRQVSPALSTISSLTSIDATPPPFGVDGTTHAGQVPPPAKRRKLTFMEKEVRREERAEKDRLKAEQKARKDEEKQAKDEEQRLKNELKEEKRRQKEMEKLQKDGEKQRKERAQPRIVSFFAKPQQPSVSSPANTPNIPSSSHEAIPLDSTQTSVPPSTTYYDRMFLPFSLPSNTTCAPFYRFSWDEAAIAHLEDVFDKKSRNSDPIEEHGMNLQNVLCLLPWEATSRGVRHSVKDAMIRLAKSCENSVDSNGSKTSVEILKTLRAIPTKFIYFHEDIRPPYVGTYTKGIVTGNGYRVARNPFRKARIDTDYEYDSEAEWEEPEEGEDLESEGESDAESVDTTEDLEGFLDDEDSTDGQLRRKFLAGDIEPVCSGLHWECGNMSDPDDDLFKFGTLKLKVIQPSHKLPIDPYSTSYWGEDEKNVTMNSTALVDLAIGTRLPLQSRQNPILGGVYNTLNTVITCKPASAKISKASPRLLSGEDLEEFKRAIEGSRHNKQGLLAILKKDRFPKIPAAVLKDTLGTYGARAGKAEAEKRWIVVNPP